MKPGLIVLFGSGEMSPSGRKIHEDVLKLSGFKAPVAVGILETPTGFEVNAIHAWPERMQMFLEKGLKNYKPVVTRIRAWRRDGEYSTEDPKIVGAILGQDYLYCGAGSPGYTIKHLKNTLAERNLIAAHKQGSVLCLGSATAVSVSKHALPVYEIFKAGADLYWMEGLDLFEEYGLDLTIVPHWNNREGEDFDTTRCWMGEARFEKMRNMLPKATTILGIDEQTAVVVDVTKQEATVKGIGQVRIIKEELEKIFKTDETFSLKELN